MNTFDRHIIARLAVSFLALTGALIVFFIVLHYVEYIDDFLDRGATMRQVFWRDDEAGTLGYYPSYIPEIIRLTSPLAIFLAAVYLTGKLAQSLQLAALQMSGVSLYRLLWPYLLVGVVLSAIMFGFNGWVVPRTNANVLAFEQNYLKSAPRQIDISDIHRQNSPGTYISVGFFDRRANMAHRVSLHELDAAQRLVRRLDAERMDWIDSLATWRLRTLTIRHFDAGGQETHRKQALLDTTLNVFPRDFARTERDVESMPIPAARDYIDALRRSGAGNLGRTLVAYYSKFAYPLANLIVVLLAVPLASVRRRGGQAVQIGLGLLMAFFYLALMKVVEPFGYAGTLAPAVATWLPHAVFLLVALVLLVRARK